MTGYGQADVHCSVDGCGNTYKSNYWASVKAHSAGWFVQKNGDVFCPEHTPDWVAEWRGYKHGPVVNVTITKRIVSGEVFTLTVDPDDTTDGRQAVIDYLCGIGGDDDRRTGRPHHSPAQFDQPDDRRHCRCSHQRHHHHSHRPVATQTKEARQWQSV